jgi:uncharacterized protein
MRGAFAGFDWDTGNWPKCGKHGVSQEEIEEVLSGRPSVRPDRYPADAEARFDAVGRIGNGRHVFIVFTIRMKNGRRLIRPISARYMHQKEIDHYERQEGKGP